MQSSNPVFARSEGFNGRRTSQSGVTYPGYNDSSAWGTGSSQAPETYAPARPTAPMTIDSVVQKTGITLGLVDPERRAHLGAFVPSELLGMAWMGGAFAGLGLALVISFKRVVSPALVLAYAAVEGLFVGAMSKTFEAMWRRPRGRRGRRHGRRRRGDAGGLQVLQHPGRPQVPQVRRGRHVRLRRRGRCSTSC